MAVGVAGRDSPRTDWGAFARLLVAAALALFAAGMGFLLAVDPYDSGRTGLLGRAGLPHQYPTTANASRARNPAYDAAIFGNSRVQQLRPERLDKLTGLSFVSLIIPGSIPADQLAVLRRFLATHPTSARAVVLGIDTPWCQPELKLSDRFPDWLYDPSLLRYVAGLARWRSFEAAVARITYLRTGRNEARPDGYWNYEPVFAQMGLADPEASRRRLAAVSPAFPPNPEGRYPALDGLRAAFASAPPRTTFVLLRPPIYRSGLPIPDTDAMKALQACAAAVRAVAATRPGTAVIDLLQPGPIAQDPANFYDYDHYRDPVAVEIETLIASGLAANAR